MKNPLQLFRSRRPRPAYHLTDLYINSRNRGPSSATVVISLTLLASCFAGLAAGLQWLRSGEPKDDRPWESHETLVVPPPADKLAQSGSDPNPDAFVVVDEPLMPIAPLPAIAEGPPTRVDEPSLPDDADKAATIPESLAPPPVKKRPETPKLSESVPPARKRTAEQADIALGGHSPFEVLEKEVREFVSSYLVIAEQELPEREAAFYADSVDYFSHGRVSRRFIETDQKNYYRRWPRRDYNLIEPPQLVEIGSSDVVVKFRINYSVRGNRESASGRTENRVRLRRVSSGFRITAIQERKWDGLPTERRRSTRETLFFLRYLSSESLTRWGQL